MKSDFDETTFYADSTFGSQGKGPPGFSLSTFEHMSLPPKRKRRWRVLLGLVFILAGYVALNANADAATGWLIARVFAGLGLLLGGAILAVGPMLAVLSQRWG
jgi:uncharacterized membrane protein HdeD (DUF308 family)